MRNRIKLGCTTGRLRGSSQIAQTQLPSASPVHERRLVVPAQTEPVSPAVRPVPQTGRRFFLAVALLLLLPHIFASPGAPTPLHLGLPRIWSGDEPHYLLILNSVLNDGDLDLSNNYASVHAGSEQAGLRFSREPTLDHHTTWVDRGGRVNWQSQYLWKEPDGWQRDALSKVTPVARPGAQVGEPGHAEYPTHAPGLAFLLAPVLVPFRGTTYLEPAAVFCSWLAVVGALYFFGLLVQAPGQTVFGMRLATVIAFLGTPVWFYGRALLTEPYLLCFTLGAYALYLRMGKAFLAGVLIALGMQLKCYFLLLLLPLAVDALRRKDYKALAGMVVPAALSAGVILWLNQRLYGAIGNASQVVQARPFWHGLICMVFSCRHGLVAFVPALLVALLCWPDFAQENRREAVLFSSAFGLYLVFHVAYACCGCGGFGPRFVVPVLPLALVPLTRLLTLELWRNPSARVKLAGVLALSLLVNAMGALPYWGYCQKHPLVEEIQATFWKT
jgi:hypothetical protein